MLGYLQVSGTRASHHKRLERKTRTLSQEKSMTQALYQGKKTCMK